MGLRGRAGCPSVKENRETADLEIYIKEGLGYKQILGSAKCQFLFQSEVSWLLTSLISTGNLFLLCVFGMYMHKTRNFKQEGS